MSAPTESQPIRMDVAIAIVVRQARVLICQRREDDVLAGYWEFPGGKRHANESHEECLMRELVEELAIVVRITEALEVIEHDYPHARVRLHPFLCEYVSGDPQPLAASQLAWVSAPDLRHYRFPAANSDLIRALIERLTANP